MINPKNWDQHLRTLLDEMVCAHAVDGTDMEIHLSTEDFHDVQTGLGHPMRFAHDAIHRPILLPNGSGQTKVTYIKDQDMDTGVAKVICPGGIFIYYFKEGERFYERPRTKGPAPA